jgi:EAL domain-containing protein (putative c-di-GMP-specific phosphodiesterase class I)
VSRSIALAHIVRREDGTSDGVWGPYVLKSAFQPIFAFDEGRLVPMAFEGLVRPFRDELPLRPYDFFLAVAAADRFHVETLCRNLHLLNAGACLDPAAAIFINFDPSLFCERALVQSALRDMRLVLHEAGIEPTRVVCEVTEHKSVSHHALTEFVQLLREHRFRIAVDDYGAEDSDMQRVTLLQPDIVKFDAQWITRLMDSRPGQALLGVMVQQFAEAGIVTIFEGIEESWQLEAAEEAGASMVQGFILARPELAPTSFGQLGSLASVSGSTVADQPREQAFDSATAAHPARRRQVFGRRTGEAG